MIYGVAFSVIKNNMKKFVIFITTDAPHFSLFLRLLLSSDSTNEIDSSVNPIRWGHHGDPSRSEQRQSVE